MNLLQFLPRRLPGVTASARTLAQRVPPTPRLLPFQLLRSSVMSALRPASLLLAAVALLALVGALALPATTQAQDSTCTLNTGDLWCGEVTVAALNEGTGTFGHGFLDADPDQGALSDTTFSVGTNDYTIDLIYVNESLEGGTLQFSLTSNLTAADKATLVLHIDGSSDTFAFSPVAPNAVSGYEWEDTGLDWSSTSTVTLRLREGTGTPTLSTDATLRGLVVYDDTSNLTLTPTFASDTETYTASVANDVAEVGVTETPSDSGASIDYLDGSDMTLDDANNLPDDGHQVTLAEGVNVIKVKVTAADGVTTKTYTVTVNRAAPDTTAPTLTSASASSNGSRLNLYFSEDLDLPAMGSLLATIRGAFSLTVDAVEQEISKIELGFGTGANRLLVSPSSTIYSGQTVVVSYDQSAAGTDAIADPAGNEIADFTTGDDGVPAVVNHSTQVEASSDATLSGLTVTAGGTDLVTFAADTETYTAMVANDVAEVTVTATKNDSGASIDYLDGDDMTLDDADTGVDGHQVTLAEGVNVIKVKVTAADSSTKTYTVTVSRAAAASTCTLNTGDLWCGVVTVGTNSDGVGFVAAETETDTDVGALTDNNGDQTITIGSDSYTIPSLLVLSGARAGTLAITLDKSFPTDDVNTLEFDVGSKTFKVSEATAYPTGHGYFWADSDLTWSDGADVTLRPARDGSGAAGAERGEHGGARERWRDLHGDAVGGGHDRRDGDLDGVDRDRRQRGGGGFRVDDGDGDRLGEPDDGDVRGADGRRHPRRGRRYLHADAVEPVGERDAGVGRDRDGYDHRQRRAADHQRRGPDRERGRPEPGQYRGRGARIPVPGDAVGGQREAGAVHGPPVGTGRRHGGGCGPDLDCGLVAWTKRNPSR